MAGQPPPPPPPPPVWLFKKKLNRRDVANAGVLSEVVIEKYLQKMKTVLAKLMEEERYFFLRIMAEDPMGDAYELRFAYNADGNYAVFHQWGDVVTSNDLREGDTVECLGNFIGDDEIHANLYIHRENQDSKLKVPLILPTANRGPESKPYGGEKPKLLFEKNLDSGDVDPFLGELQFRRCNKRLKTALEETPSIRVSTVDPNNNVELTRLTITRYVTGDRYVIYHAWREVVTINGLKEGDSIVGYGNHVGRGEFRVQLYVLRDKQPPSDAKRGKRRMSDEELKMEEERKKEKRRKEDEELKMEEERKKEKRRKEDEGLKTEEERKEEKRRKEEEARLTLLLLEKGSEAVLGRVVIKSTGKEQAEVVVVRGVEMEDSDEDDGGGFAMFSAKRAKGGKYEWSEEVDEDGVSKTVGGAVVGDGKVRMNIDIYKSRY